MRVEVSCPPDKSSYPEGTRERTILPSGTGLQCHGSRWGYPYVDPVTDSSPTHRRCVLYVIEGRGWRVLLEKDRDRVSSESRGLSFGQGRGPSFWWEGKR